MGWWAYFSLKKFADSGKKNAVSNLRIEKAKKARAIGVSLPPDLIRQAKKHAFSQGMSFSRFVRSLLARELIQIQKKWKRFHSDNVSALKDFENRLGGGKM